jgi:lysophospholipase L1-like esterase
MILSILSGGSKLKKVKVFFLGDSITYGIGTSGYGSTGSGIVGSHSYPQQVAALYNNSLNFSFVKLGYSGQTSVWWNVDQKASDMSLIDIDNYDLNIVVVFFGANDIAGYPVSQVYNSMVDIHDAYRLAGVKVVAVPVMNRIDYPGYLIFEGNRMTYNNLLLANPGTYDDIAQLWLEPNIYTQAAPSNPVYFAAGDVDGLTGVHPTDAGAALIAKQVKLALDRIIKSS